MPEKQSAKKTDSAKAASLPAAKKSDKKSDGLTAEERAAAKARVQELKAEARAGKDKAAGESAVLAALSAMSQPDRAIGERLHEIIKASAPELAPKTWYGMPAYATKDGKVVCFFQSADKFKTRYATLGFQHEARLDDGAMWPTSFAIKEVSEKEAARISALLKKAVG